MTAFPFFIILSTLTVVPVGPDPLRPQERRPVSRVVFEGNRRIPDALLLSKVRTRPGRPFSKAQLDADIKRLTKLGKFLPISAEYKPGPEGIEVTFFVRDRDEVRWVRFRGREAISEDDLKDLLQTKGGSLLSDYFVRLDQESIREKYLQEGYLFASVTHEIRALSVGVGVRFILEEGPRVKVREIVFEGNEQIESSDLEDQMQTKERALWGILEPGIYRESVLQEDLESLRLYCRSRGFLDSVVALDSIDFSEDREWMTPRIRIVEGEKYVVSEIGFAEVQVDAQGRQTLLEGIQESTYSETFLKSHLSLQVGKPILGKHLQADVEAIQRLYQKASYIHAIARTRVEPEKIGPRVKVIYMIRTGRATRVGKIIVRGNDKTQSKVIRRDMAFYPGDPFDIEALEESYTRLRQRRYYRRVDVSLEPDVEGDGIEDVVVEVEEDRTGSLLIGGGIASTVGFFGNFQLIQTNFDITKIPTSLKDLSEGHFLEGGGQTLRLVAQPGRQRSFYQAAFTEPYFLDLPLIFGLDVFFRDRNRFDYTEGRVGGTLTLGHQLSAYADVQMRYRLENVFITDVERDAPSDVFRVEGRNRLASVTFAYSLDTRRLDRSLVVYDGGKFVASYEWATRLVGSDIDLNKLHGRSEYYFKLYEIPDWGKIVFRAWAEAGWVEGTRGTSDVPIFERYFIGGPPSLRGFEFREVGPSERGKPIGGTIMTVEGIELQFPIIQDIFRGVLFIDTGNLAEDTSFFSLNEHRVSVGVGVRIKVPIFPAPVELDFGFPIRKEPGDERRTFSFFIGFPF